MSIFALPTGVEAEQERDTVGGGGAVASAIYDGVVEMFYIDSAGSGAKNVNVMFKTSDGKSVKQTIYISNRAGEFTYKDKKDGSLKPLPGYNQISSFLEAVTGKPITDQAIEEKTIKVYDFEAKAEVPVKRHVFMDTINKPMKAVIVRVNEEKTSKESNYKVGTGEFRQINEFEKFLDATTGRTTLEVRAGNESADYAKVWLEKRGGKDKQRPAKQSAGSTAAAGAPTTAAAPTSSLFSQP